MKLSKVMKKYGFKRVADVDIHNTLLYTNGDLYFGVQKIGNVFRVDAQQVMMGVLPVTPKLIDNHIIPNNQLASFVHSTLKQITGQASEQVSVDSQEIPT